LEQYPWILVFEALHTGDAYEALDDISKQKFDKLPNDKVKLIISFNTYFWNYLLKSIFNKLTKVINYTNTWVDIK